MKCLFFRPVNTDQFNHGRSQFVHAYWSPKIGQKPRYRVLGQLTAVLGSENQNLPGFGQYSPAGGKTPDAGKSVWGKWFFTLSIQGRFTDAASKGDPRALYRRSQRHYRNLKENTFDADETAFNQGRINSIIRIPKF